jgi:hypothetical protein
MLYKTITILNMKTRNFITDNRRFDHFDKIRSYYIDDTELSDMQHKKRLQYEQAHQLINAGYAREDAVKILVKKGMVNSDREGYRACACAEILFGDVAASNKKGLKVILTENLFKRYRRAIKQGNLRESLRALENIAKINGLMNNNEAIDYSQLTIPIPVYTTNPAVLKRDRAARPAYSSITKGDIYQ